MLWGWRGPAQTGKVGKEGNSEVGGNEDPKFLLCRISVGIVAVHSAFFAWPLAGVHSKPEAGIECAEGSSSDTQLVNVRHRVRQRATAA